MTRRAYAATAILGSAIGHPDLRYARPPDVAETPAGCSQNRAAPHVEMARSGRSTTSSYTRARFEAIVADLLRDRAA